MPTWADDPPAWRAPALLQVTVDNETYDDRTIITVDSANRPGTLVEVVQCLTELGLNVKKARISSDGG
jgi:UTP:GlnB (protein PII) uridylyltransferase